MLIVRNNIIPGSRYVAITLWPFIFVRKDAVLDENIINHEYIHGEQQVEMLWLFFYIWYVIEYIIKLVKYRNHRCAYRNVGFEIEAYVNEDDENYLDNRKHYCWFEYMNND